MRGTEIFCALPLRFVVQALLIKQPESRLGCTGWDEGQSETTGKDDIRRMMSEG
jgi:hypothetical protein